MPVPGGGAPGAPVTVTGTNLRGAKAAGATITAGDARNSGAPAAGTAGTAGTDAAGKYGSALNL